MPIGLISESAFAIFFGDCLGIEEVLLLVFCIRSGCTYIMYENKFTISSSGQWHTPSCAMLALCSIGYDRVCAVLDRATLRKARQLTILKACQDIFVKACYD